MTETIATFRFKFTPDFAELLYGFAQLHRFDNRHLFKEAWDEWINKNEELINNEIIALKSNGYKGMALDKMYKSARYYFRKKRQDKNEPKDRRRYVGVDNEVIKAMDDHILEQCRYDDFRPSNGFNDFCDTHKSLLEKEVVRLYTKENLTTQEISPKLKKTYKNRYYQKVKAPSLASAT